MKIAFATDNGKNFMDRHFGDAQYYDIYEIVKDKADFLKRIINTTEEDDEHIHADPKKAKGVVNLFKDEELIRQDFIPELRKVFEEGKIANIIIDYSLSNVEHVQVKNPTHKINNSIFTPILDDSGKVSNVICQTIDLTDIKKAEKA